VGGFVLGAVALTLGAVVILSSGEWFVKKDRFALYFPGSVAGLMPGAAVTVRGIKVGEVKEVDPWATGRDDQPIQIEVVIEIRPDRVKVPRGTQSPYQNLDSRELAQVFINHGLRARLLGQSLLTGQKLIDLDFLPKEPARFAAVGVGVGREYPELPTSATGIERLGDRAEQIVAKLADLPFDTMLDDLQKSLASLRSLLQSDALQGTLGATRRSADELAPTLSELRKTMVDLRAVVDGVGGDVRQTSTRGQQTLEQAQVTLARAEKTLAQMDATLRSTDQTRIDAARAFDELERTLRALRTLVDYIQTHPEAIVLGKPKTEERK
jgi:paraquat-inducible protein B